MGLNETNDITVVDTTNLIYHKSSMKHLTCLIHLHFNILIFHNNKKPNKENHINNFFFIIYFIIKSFTEICSLLYFVFENILPSRSVVKNTFETYLLNTFVYICSMQNTLLFERLQMIFLQDYLHV